MSRELKRNRRAHSLLCSCSYIVELVHSTISTGLSCKTLSIYIYAFWRLVHLRSRRRAVGRFFGKTLHYVYLLVFPSPIPPLSSVECPRTRGLPAFSRPDISHLFHFFTTFPLFPSFCLFYPFTSYVNSFLASFQAVLSLLLLGNRCKIRIIYPRRFIQYDGSLSTNFTSVSFHHFLLYFLPSSISEKSFWSLKIYGCILRFPC